MKTDIKRDFQICISVTLTNEKFCLLEIQALSNFYVREIFCMIRLYLNFLYLVWMFPGYLIMKNSNQKSKKNSVLSVPLRFSKIEFVLSKFSNYFLKLQFALQFVLSGFQSSSGFSQIKIFCMSFFNHEKLWKDFQPHHYR